MQDLHDRREDAVRALDRFPAGLRHPLVITVAALIGAVLLFLAGVRVGELTYDVGWVVPVVLVGLLVAGAAAVALGVRLDRRRSTSRRQDR